MRSEAWDSASVTLEAGRQSPPVLPQPAAPVQSLRVSGHVIGQELERDKTAEFGVLSLVDYAHPAPAEFFDDAVARNGLADHQGQILRT